MSCTNRLALARRAPARLLPTVLVALGVAASLPGLPRLQAASEKEVEEGAIRQIQRLDRDTGFALTGDDLLATHDGGRTWSDISPRPLPTGSEVFFRDATRGFVAGVDPAAADRLALLATADGGRSWSEQSLEESAFGGGAYASARVHFVDADHGFVLGQRATSAALSAGELLRTDDGGQTWTRLPAPPVAGRFAFADRKRGFMSGAPVAERLYRTLDGGRTWQELNLGLRAAPGRALYDLPVFRSPDEGSLAVTLRGPRPRLMTFLTRDGGRTWRRGSSGVLPEGDYDEPVATVLDEAGRPRVLDLSLVTARGAGTTRAASVVAVAVPVTDGDAGESWVLTAEGVCDPQGCRQMTELVAVESVAAGKGTQTSRRLLTRSQGRPAAGRKAPSLGAAAASISTKKGFDKCAAATSSQMQTWWTASPYYDANIYFGGSARGCAQPNLNAAWVKSIFSQGWRLIPTWVGPQSPCSTFSKRFSGDAAVARNQGLAEADAAVAAAAALGLGAGTPVYYDMEHYNPTASCSTAVRAFVSAWAERLGARGYVSGMYGTASNTQADWRPDVLARPLGAVWVAAWACTSSQTTCNVNPSVFGLAPLSDAHYANNQRLRQYWGGHNETWGGITFNVDSNIASGPVAAPGAPSLPDLVVDSLTASPPSPKAGEAVTFTAVVRNAGAAPTPVGAGLGVGYEIDGSQVSWGAVEGPLAAGASVTIGTQGGPWIATAGAHALVAVADDLNRFPESDEGNNERSLSLVVVSDPCRPAVAADRWKSEFFAGRDLAGAPLRVRDDGAAGLDFDWGSGSPDPACGVPVDAFSSRFTRSVTFPPGRHRFTVTGDDGVRLFVAGTLVVDEWRDQVATFSKDVTLAGGPQVLVLEHYENLGGAQARLSWRSLEPAVVDDGDPGFELLQTPTGKAEWWHKETGLGYGNDMVWTSNTLSRKDNYARWKPALPGAGRYKVEAHIPHSHASTTKATYKVLAGVVTTTRVVNQAPLYDAWADLGTYDFRADGAEYVELADVTGEPSNSKQIAFDAVRFTPADAPLPDGGWSFPVGSAESAADWRVTLPLGASWTASSGQQYNGHLAEDWSRLDGKSLGQPVYAAADGEVVVAKQNCGNYVDVVVLKHAVAGLGDIYSMYGHIETTVKVGDRLKRRQQLGVLGNPVTFGPHLHFEVKDNAALVNKPFSACAVPAQGVYVSAGYSGKRNDYAGGDFWDPSNDGVVGNRYYHPTRFIRARLASGTASALLAAPAQVAPPGEGPRCEHLP